MPAMELPNKDDPGNIDLCLYQKGTNPGLPGALIMSRKKALPPDRKDETRIVAELLENESSFANYKWFVGVHSGIEYWGYARKDIIAIAICNFGNVIWVLDPPPDDKFTIKPESEYEIFTNDVIEHNN